MDTSVRAGMGACLADNPPAANAKLMGWAVIAEWETPEGEKVLSRVSSDNMSRWGFRGYLHEALDGAWTASADGWDGNGR
jgi:hypothetical protein